MIIYKKEWKNVYVRHPLGSDKMLCDKRLCEGGREVALYFISQYEVSVFIQEWMQNIYVTRLFIEIFCRFLLFW